MMPLIGDHLWQSTLVGSAAALLAFALRAHRANVRYTIWLTASVKFLLPFAVLSAAGSAAAVRWAPPIAAPQTAAVIDMVGAQLAQPFTPSTLAARASTAPPLSRTLALAAVTLWLCGMAAMAALWWIRWRRVRAVARAGRVLTTGREADILRGLDPGLTLVACAGTLEPGVFGILRPVLLWPEAISVRLSDDQIAAIMAHEIAHVRRHDNLTAALHMVVQTIFWFHPLVWWIGARLAAERERACDEAVLHDGREPATYAEALLETCEFSIESPLACVSGVTGADLTRRIEAIMRNRSAAVLSARRKLAMLLAGVGVLVAPVLAGGLRARPLQAPAQEVAPGEPLEFDVASIKPNDGTGGLVSIRMLPGGAYEAINVTMRALIQQAFRMSERQVIGGPDWLERDRFDVLAKPPQGGAQGEIPGRLQTLLVERLHLKTHRETRDMPIYALVLARDDGTLGPQIKSSPVDCSPGAAARGRGNAPAGGRANGPAPAVGGARGRQQMPMPAMPPLGSEPRPCGMMLGPTRVMGGGATMATLANMLQNNTGRIVQDRTSLAGSFDFDLEFTPDPALRGRGPGGGLPGQAPAGGPGPDPDSVSIFTAVQEQLGLRLESATAPVEVLVIDSAERPAEN